jgi:PAS domain S-box-containing protein
MALPLILLVEDDTHSRRAAREALKAHGYSVVEASTAAAALEAARTEAPSVVLFDASLPDMAPAEAVRRLRAAAGGEALPVVGLLGLLARPGEGGLAAAGFDDFLVKPIDPGALLECVAAHLAWAGPGRGRPGRGRRVIVADDDPDYQAVARIRLTLAGFEVATACDGVEALEKARARPPDVIASDVLMPRLDGLGLCMEVRKDPALAKVPVVLFSGNYLEKADRKLAQDAGCTAFVVRTGDLKELVEKVIECSVPKGQGAPAPAAPAAPADVEAERRIRALRQLERQAAVAVSLTRRNRMLQAELGILAAVAGALSRSGDHEEALRDAFVAGFDAWALCPAALYTLGPDGGPVFRARSGYGDEAGPALEGFFGRRELAARALATREPVFVQPTGVPRAAEDDFLEAAGALSALVVPLMAAGEPAGVLLLASPRDDLDDPEVRAFAVAAAGQLAQAVSLASTVARLRCSEERYRCLVENANDALFLLDASGEILEANRRAEELLGRPAADIRQHRLRDFAAPDAADTGWEDLARVPTAGSVRVELVHIARPDGSTVPAEVSASLVRIGSRDLVLAIARDESRRRALERRLFMAQKMEAVGQLAGGIAHDFNNLLMVVNGYSEILLGKTPESAPGHHELEEVLKAGQKAAALTSQLLGFSRRQIVRPRVLDLPVAIAELETDLRKLAGPKAELVLQHAPEVSPVKIDPAQLEQVLLQLVLNAREATEAKGGAIVVGAADVVLDEAFARDNDGARPGPHVVLSVTDNGCGMDEATLAHVFEPFYTTKEPGKGSGLGLATVYGIVKQNEGYVKVESRTGQGTAVRVYLPRVGPVPGPPGGERKEADEGKGKERSATVLVVEDEWAVRSLIQHVLRDAGYAVLEAGTGTAALELAGKCRERIDLLLTDVAMPGMTGKEVAQRLRAERPGLRVLFISGYAYDSLFEGEEESSATEFLPKPFAPDQLLEKVEALLQAGKKKSA